MTVLHDTDVVAPSADPAEVGRVVRERYSSASGDPSKYCKEGDVVVDLGSGGGKICYIASQIVGEAGHVHGVDMTDDMLDLARRHQDLVAARIGWKNTTFHKGYIQDLRTDLDEVEAYL